MTGIRLGGLAAALAMAAATARDFDSTVVTVPELLTEEIPDIKEVKVRMHPKQQPMKLHTMKQVPKNQKRFKPRGRR